MTSKADKEVIEDEKAAEKAYQRRRKKSDDFNADYFDDQTTTEVVPPGCSEPNTQPPSVAGTSYDTTRAGAPPKPDPEE